MVSQTHATDTCTEDVSKLDYEFTDNCSGNTFLVGTYISQVCVKDLPDDPLVDAPEVVSAENLY